MLVHDSLLFRELRDVIMNFITSLRPYGGKNLPKADFAFMSLNNNESYIKNSLYINDKISLAEDARARTSIINNSGR